ncbi:MAG: MBL fold metallo-hydrolase [Phycisphaerales bacterium]|nr:MAG: MBL fold metallo-hydrolase [Phycisphaerales bacterium]
MTTPGTTVCIDSFPLGPYETNCHLVWVESEHDDKAKTRPAWIIDAGFDPEPMLAKARELGLTPERILLTHAHVDHIAGLEEVRAAYPGVPVAIHPAEREWLASPELNLSAGFGVPITARDAEDTLEHGQRLDLAGSHWKVLHVPGHSPGSCVFYCEAADVAIVGDTLFNGSIGRTDFPTSDHEALIRGIREKLYALDGDTRCLPGHGAATTIDHERATNPFVRA